MIQIGLLQVSLADREVRLHGEAVRIGSRAFDILELLIRSDGRLVSKGEIMQYVWPHTIVEENNLQVHIAAIRKMLGKDRDRVVTVPGRGYRLTGVTPPAPPAPLTVPVQREVAGAAATAAGTELHFASASTLLGRQSAVAQVLETMQRAPLVTLVGAGGIGKTRLAAAVAEQLRPQFADGVAFVSLGPVSGAQPALDTLASALGIKLSSGCPGRGHIAREVAGKHCLIVLDNCEHVVDEAAAMAELLVTGGERVRVLATSREALRAPSEVLYHVAPLQVPDSEAQGAGLLQASAVQLLLARARAVAPGFPSDERSLFLMGEICRHLDGIPLAIELAAARAAVLGIEVLAARLDDRLRILSGGYRTALPRHQTLRATLDWSYRLLDATGQKLLRWLGVFVDTFSFESAAAIGASFGLAQTEVLEALAGLVSKSLVARADVGTRPGYRLLQTTRAYALQQLDDNGEREAAAAAHARWLGTRAERASREPAAKPLTDTVADGRQQAGKGLTRLCS